MRRDERRYDDDALSCLIAMAMCNRSHDLIARIEDRL
jgi:hypothetical protein